MKIALIIGFGIAGVLLRHGCNEFLGRLYQGSFPAVTFTVNIIGSFAIGAVYVLGSERGVIAPELRFGIMTGLLGGFTTFSAFSLEVVRLLESQQYLPAMAYAALSPVLGVIAAAAGMWAVRQVA